MSVRIILASYLQPYAGGQESMAVGGSTVQECIHDLTRRYPAIAEMLVDNNGDLLPYVNIFVNESSIYPEEITKPVKDGDEIYLLYLIGGG